MAPNPLNPTEKVAVLLLALGEETSAEILRTLPEKQVQQIGIALSRINRIDQEQVQEILAEFSHMVQTGQPIIAGNSQASERLLAKMSAHIGTPIGAGQGVDIARQEISEYTDEDLVRFLAVERVQVVALVIACLEPARAAAVIKKLPKKIRDEATTLMANPQEPDNETLEVVLAGLKESASRSGAQPKKIGGKDFVAKMLKGMDSTQSENLLAQIQGRDEALGNEVRSELFKMDDLIDFNPSQIQKILQNTTRGEWEMALRLAKPNVQDHILAQFSPRVREEMESELSHGTPIKKSDAERTWQALVEQIEQLVADGIIHSPNEDLV